MKRIVIIAAAILSLALMASGGRITGCVSFPQDGCYIFDCPKGVCCNFGDYLFWKNNMYKGRAHAAAGCTIYYNSNCKGTTFKLTTTMTNLPGSMKYNNAAIRCHS